jgi:CubicO group peptidase (beta-lactamase class C family)
MPVAHRRWVSLLVVLLAAGTLAGQSGDTNVAALIEPIWQSMHLPSLGAAIVTEKGLEASGVTGVRKAGTNVSVTIDDVWHLGSDTKAMTAVVLATLVERGKLTWETAIGEVFPELANTFPSEFRAITMTQLLSHHAGLQANIDWQQASQSRVSLGEQRIFALKTAAANKLDSHPGTKYLYSNLGYTIAGTIAERVSGKQWENLIQDIVFVPLGMNSCGFGGTGTPGTIDQPWPHAENGKPRPLNGPLVDNPEVMGPAGTVHCSIADWAKFITDQLRGERGAGALLKPETYRALHTPRFGGNYAFGWGVASRTWADGTVFQHSGSNTMNFCTVWIAPNRAFAVLAVTNQGGMAAAQGTDEAVAALIRKHNGSSRGL